MDSLRILGLRLKQFDWLSNGEHDIGYIAEDIQEILPELYTENNGVGGYRQDELIFYVIEVVKTVYNMITDQQATITALQTQVASQQQQITDLQTRMERLEVMLTQRQDGGTN